MSAKKWDHLRWVKENRDAVFDAVFQGRIVDVTIGDAGFISLRVETVAGDKSIDSHWLDIQSDPEGNGPGFLNIESDIQGFTVASRGE